MSKFNTESIQRENMKLGNELYLLARFDRQKTNLATMCFSRRRVTSKNSRIGTRRIEIDGEKKTGTCA